MNRRLRIVALAVLAVLAIVGVPAFSGATFVASSKNTASVRAANDWTPPTVALQNPGSPIKDTVTLTATATDGETGIASVAIQYQAAGASAWTTICTATSSPYSCSWNTKTVSDGSYDLRAVATDGSGYTTNSSSWSTVVSNSVTVVLANPGDVLRGTVSTNVTIYGGGLSVFSVRTEYAVAGSGNWKTLCTSLVLPSYSCSWNTTTFANGDYDLRAVATAGTTSYTSAVITDVAVDNLAPTVTMTDPGTPLRGTVTLAATAADANTGVAQVVIQYAPTGSSTWTTACTLSVDPYSCRFDTTKLAYGSYGFRAVATDVAGNATTSAVIANRQVDNTVSSVSVEDPGAFLSGTVTVSANAASTAGVTSVRIQRAPSGTTTWTDLCTDTTSPYSCSWDTTTVAEGLYDLRALMVDATGATTTSATVTGRRVDNSPLKAYDVQTTNGGTAGKLGVDDSITMTYTDQVNLATITSGWTGSALAVTLRLRDGNLVGLGAKNDTVDVLRNGNAVNLGSVNLREDYIKSNKTAQFNATMTASTTTVNGLTVTVIRIVVGTLASGSGLKGGTNGGAMIWTPSATATDLNGRAASTAPATERGTADREF